MGVPMPRYEGLVCATLLFQIRPRGGPLIGGFTMKLVSALSMVLALGITVSANADTIVARGSSTCTEVAKDLSEAFKAKTGHEVVIEGGGSSKGAKDVLAGEVDLGLMSRAPKQKELDAGMVAHKFGIDGVAVVVHKDNPTDGLTTEALRDMYTGKTEKWDDGSPVMLLNRNAESGTRECFEKNVMDGQDISAKARIKHTAAALSTLQKARSSIFYISAGEVTDETPVKVLQIDGVEPSVENLTNGSYPISRGLFIGAKGEAQGVAKEFVDFILSAEGQAIVQKHGFVSVGGA